MRGDPPRPSIGATTGRGAPGVSTRRDQRLEREDEKLFAYGPQLVGINGVAAKQPRIDRVACLIERVGVGQKRP